jgi:hypothetical protein
MEWTNGICLYLCNICHMGIIGICVVELVFNYLSRIMIINNNLECKI